MLKALARAIAQLTDPAIFGVLIVVMMVWLPGGLLSIPDRLRAARVVK